MGDVTLGHITDNLFKKINCRMLNFESLPGIQVSFAAVLDGSSFCFLTSPSQRLLF